MQNQKIGFIGAGNMGGALARAVRRALPDAGILLSNRRVEKSRALAEEIGGKAAANGEIAEECDTIFLGVKPYLIHPVLEEIAPILAKRTEQPLIISMAARITLEELESCSGGAPMVRIMPNTPVSIGKGVTLYTLGTSADDSCRDRLLALLSASGSLIEIAEAQIDAAGGVSGCGPAFVDLFLEALADGAVYCGVPREQAMELAAEMTAGAAALAAESKVHPGVLKDAVCSPGGSTIRGVRKLEQGGLRSAVIEAILASTGKE